MTVKLLYASSPPVPLMAQWLQSALSLAGPHVDLVPAAPQIFFGNYWENPSSAKHDARDVAFFQLQACTLSRRRSEP